MKNWTQDYLHGTVVIHQWLDANEENNIHGAKIQWINIE